MVKNSCLVRNHLTPRESGLKGLFRGLDSKLLQSVLAAGFMFLAYEKVFHVIIIFIKKDKNNNNLKNTFSQKIAALVFAILGARRKA